MFRLYERGIMLFSNGALTALAKQNDDYTDANIKNDGGVGGTVFGDKVESRSCGRNGQSRGRAEGGGRGA